MKNSTTALPVNSLSNPSAAAYMTNEGENLEENGIQQSLQSVKNTSLELPLTVCTNDEKNQRIIKEPIPFKSGKLAAHETDAYVSASRQAQFIQYADETFRVKNPIHGNYHAAEEVVMGSLFSMTGLDAPQLLLCNHCDDFFIFNQETREDFSEEKNLSQFACVASKFEPSFRDLGTFLLDTKTMVDLIRKSEVSMPASDQHIEHTVNHYLQQVQCFHDTHNKLLSINESYPRKSYRNNPEALKEARKQSLIKFSSLEKMNSFLPQELRDEQIKHYFVSLLLNNWDFLNSGFCNFGYFHTEVGGIQKIKGMSVDFGSSGTLSDQFHHNKYESYEETMDTNNHDREMSAMILNLSFLKEDATFSSHRPPSLTAISASPFSRQFLSTIKGLVKAEKDFYETKDFNNFKKELAPALEVAYRLLVLPDAPIEDYLRENWIMGESDFPYRDKDPQQNVDTAKMIQIIKDRKKAFVQYFGENVIQNWEGKNVLQAGQARKEIEGNLERLLHKKYVIQPLAKRRGTV